MKKKVLDLESVLRQGINDAKNGLGFAHCPYTDMDDPKRKAWQNAWQKYHFAFAKKNGIKV